MVSEDPSVVYGASYLFDIAESCLVPLGLYLIEYCLESQIDGAFSYETMFFQEWHYFAYSVFDSVDLQSSSAYLSTLNCLLELS